MSKTKK